MTVSAFEKDTTAALRRVTGAHESIVLKSGRRTVAVVLPPEVLQRLEDATDAREADRIYAEVQAGKEKVLPFV